MDQLIFSLYFQYVDVSRHDPFFKSKHVNVIKVPRSNFVRSEINTKVFQRKVILIQSIFGSNKDKNI
ncbi:hypothetical protein H5410_014446 [Solanum commersonii]|uniref:Uncharacterized protein n=1 Tax=Solanum commersonii TaxID=4109 RepID=A0A9J5ZR00_SOLCO|nr:hypothetical protein H5410_014446 [Solanum commersonii]